MSTFKPLAWGLAVLTLLGAVGMADASPFPFRKGTRWEYRAEDSKTTSLLVEGLTRIETKAGLVSAALVRRSDGTDRIVFRTPSEWLECRLVQGAGKRAACLNPFVFYRWPIAVGDRWQSPDMDFMVTDRIPVDVPLKTFSDAWRIAYSPTGSSDPMGEFWVANGVGRIRISEAEQDFQLAKYEPGTGPELGVSSNAAVAALIGETPPPKTKRGSIVSRWLVGMKDPAYGWLGLPLVLIAALIVLVVVIKRSIGEQAQWDSLAPVGDLSERAKLLATVADSGDLKSTIQRLRDLVSENPRYPDLRHQLARVLKGEGEFEAARKEWEEAVRLNPDYIDARLALAQLLLANGEPAEAARHYADLAQRRPTFADVHLGLGKSYLALGNQKEAEAAFESALRINPKLEEAERLLLECRELAHSSRASASSNPRPT